MIREAEPSDYITMDELFRGSAKAFCIDAYDRETIEAWIGTPWPERFVQSKEDGNEQYVSEIDGNVVCFGSINIVKQLLVSLFVDPDHSGNGVGQEMLQFLFVKAKYQGVKVLQIDSSLNAINFYKRNGFVEKSKGEFSTHSGVVLESVKMECVL